MGDSAPSPTSEPRSLIPKAIRGSLPPHKRLPRFGAPREWRDPQKALVIQVLLLSLTAIYLVAVRWLSGWPFFAPIHDPEILQSLVYAARAYWLAWWLLFFYTWPRRHSRRARPGLLNVTATLTPITIGQFCYVTGLHGIASTLALFGSIFIGIILLPRRIVYRALPIWCLTIAVFDWLCRQGVLPWRDLFLRGIEGGEAALWQEIARNSVLLVVMGGILVYALDQLIESWRDGEKRLEQANRTDALTGIYNRWHVLDLVSQALRRSTATFSIVMIDVDHFKAINDRFGHKIGDDVLKEVSSTLRASLRGDDILGRFGGEEFVALLMNADAASAAGVAERCRKALHALQVAGSDATITASFGVVSSDRVERNLDRLVDAADQALYQAKRDGRDRVVVYESGRAVSTPSVAIA